MNLNRIKIYDNGGKTFDRYTVVYLDSPEREPRTYECRAMSERPRHPQVFGQICTAMLGRHLGRRIKFSELPAECQDVVRADMGV